MNDNLNWYSYRKLAEALQKKYPEQYLPFAIPGLGVVIVLVAMILLGAFTTGLICLT